MVSLSAVSVTHGPKILYEKFQKSFLSFKLCSIPSSMMKPCATPASLCASVCPPFPFPPHPLSLDFHHPFCLAHIPYDKPKRKEFQSGQIELSPNPISTSYNCVTSSIFHNLSKLQFPHLENESKRGFFSELF